MREQVRGLQKEYDKTEDDLKALQVRHKTSGIEEHIMIYPLSRGHLTQALDRIIQSLKFHFVYT